MISTGVVLSIIFLDGTWGDLSVKRQHQPDVYGSGPTSAEGSVWDSESYGEDAVEDAPPLEDFLALRQRNAELALQVEELTSELRQLDHDKKMTAWRTKFTVSKIQRRCHAMPSDKNEESSIPDDLRVQVKEGVAAMPWSLTHTAARHKLKSRFFPGEAMFKGITDYFSAGSSAVAEVGNYFRKIPVLNNPAEQQPLKEIQDSLKDARVRLGRNKEARRGLEEHYNAIALRIAQLKTDAESDAKALDKAVKAEQDLDKEIAEVKRIIKDEKATNPVDRVKDAIKTKYKAESAQTQEVQNVSESLHTEVEHRMNETAKVLETLKKHNYEIQNQIEESKARTPDQQMRIEKVKTKIANLTANIGSLNEQKKDLLHEESDEETRVAKEDQQLMVMSGQLENCDDWGHKLENKLKKVIDSKKDDARLCHKSILGLHNERVMLKQELHKQHTQLKKEKDLAATVQQKGDETLAMLNHCLGRLT